MNPFDIANIVMPLILAAAALYGTFAVKKALKYTKGEPGEPGMTGATGMVGEPASLLNVIGVLSKVSELNDRPSHHLDTYIIDGTYWTYIDRPPIYDHENKEIESYQNRKFVVVGFVNGRSAENDNSIGDTYSPVVETNLQSMQTN